MKSALKSFDLEFQPYIEEIHAKEGVIRQLADAATMKRVRGLTLCMVLAKYERSNIQIQTLKMFFRILHHY